MRYPQTLVARLASKLVLDILPATTASLVGGLLFAHYGLGRATESAAQAAPASAEMMQLLRDEHGVIVSFLNAQLEREKTELASADALRHGSGRSCGDGEYAGADPCSRHCRQARDAARESDNRRDRVGAARLSRKCKSRKPKRRAFAGASVRLLPRRWSAFKDHVVSVTHRVVSALGGIPSWIGLIGDHPGGTDTKSRPLPDTIAAS